MRNVTAAASTARSATCKPAHVATSRLMSMASGRRPAMSLATCNLHRSVSLLAAAIILFVQGVLASTDQLKCMRMSEERPINTVIGNFRKWASSELEAFQVATGTSSSFLFSFSAQDNRYFQIDNRTGDITVKSRVDREALLTSTLAETGAQCMTTDAIREQAAFTSSAESTKTCEFALQVIVVHAKQYRAITLRICVDDINDNSPVWATQSLYIAIPEHRGTQFTPLPSAFDSDRSEAGKIGYRLSSTNSHFRINVTGNELYLVSTELDKETNGNYVLVLNATDYGTPPRSTVVQLNVTVVDVNDNPPVFPRKFYEVNVSESLSEVGRTLFVFHATDRDSPSVGGVRYLLGEEQLSARLFNLNEVSGQLVLIGALDYERRSSYRLRVNAYDGVHYADTVLLINVLDENDNAPEITLVAIPSGPAAVDNEAKSIRLPENTAQEQAVAFVNVFDLDTGNNSLLTCTTEDATGFALRELSVNKDSKQTSYALILQSALDRETIDQQEIIIVCRDAGTHAKTSSTTYTLLVTDVNDNAPQFSLPVYSVSIPENNEEGRFVADVSASDADMDENAQINYVIIHNPSSPASFSVESHTGRIRAQQRFDRELTSKVGVLVRATDGGQPSRSATAYLEINIEDINDNAPTFVPSNVYEFSVAENEQLGTVIGEVRAIDSDATERNNQVSYQLLRVTAGDRHPLHKAVGWFVLNEQGQLSVNSTIDYEEARSVTLRVEARDNGQPQRTSEATVIIRILDANDNQPMWLFPNAVNKTVNCSFLDPVGMLITYVSAIDLDSGLNGQILYSLKPETSASSLFALNDLTGGLYIAKALGHMSTYHHLILEARDRGNPSHIEPAVLGIYVTETRTTSSAVRTNQDTPLLALFNDQRQVILVFGLVVVTALLALVLVMTISYMKLRKQRGARFRSRRRKSGSVHDACEREEGLDENLNSDRDRDRDRASSQQEPSSAGTGMLRTEAPFKTDLDSEDDLHPIYTSHRRPTTLPTQPHCTLTSHSSRHTHAPLTLPLSNTTAAAAATAAVHSPRRKHSATHGREQQRAHSPTSTSASASSCTGTTASPTRRYPPGDLTRIAETYDDSTLYGTLTTDVYFKTAPKAKPKTSSPVRNKIITFRSVPNTPIVPSASNGDIHLLFDPEQPVASGYLTVRPTSATVGRTRKKTKPSNTVVSRLAARNGKSEIYSVVPTPAKSISERMLIQDSPCFNEWSKCATHREDPLREGNCSPSITPSRSESNALDQSANNHNHNHESLLNSSIVSEPPSPEGAKTYEANSFKPHHLKGQPCSSYV